MVHVHLTPDWGHLPDPGAVTPGAAGSALARLIGVLSIEVDGVDLTGGRAEGPLLPMVEALLRALARLQAGGRRASVPLRDGELLLVLRHRDGQAQLSLFELGPPSRTLLRDTDVELGALAAASLEAAAELGRELEALPTAGRAAARRLKALGRGLAGPVRAPRPGSPVLPSGAAEPPPGPLRWQVTLDEGAEALQRDAGAPADLASLLASGRLELHGRRGSLATVEGAPFLTLRDLAAGLEDAARSRRRREPVHRLVLQRPGRAADLLLHLDLVRRDLAVRGAEPSGASPLDLADATVAATEAFAGLARQAGQEDNPHLAELLQRARVARDHLGELQLDDAALAATPGARPPALAPSALARRPLAQGALRRVALRVIHEAHVGQPVGPGLVQAGRTALALGRESVLGLAGPGRWRVEGADWGGLAGGLLVLRRGESLVALDPVAGQLRWERPLPGGRPTGLAASRSGPLLLGEPDALTALDPATGQLRWRVELAGGTGLAVASFGALLVAASSTGLVYGFGEAGGLAWRVCGPGPALCPPLLAGGLVATLHATGPTAALLLLDPRTGRRRGEVDLDVWPGGTPVRLGAGLVLAGRSGGEAVLIRIDPRRGRAWEIEVPLGGPARLAPAGRALLAADDAGGLALVDGAGRLVWNLPADGSEGGATPAVARGVVAAARGGLSLVDLPSGSPLARHPGLAPSRLLADAALALTVLEADGAVTRLAPGGHLSVVEGTGGDATRPG
jgi:hypothetical protein